jgi:hypothetical protein
MPTTNRSGGGGEVREGRYVFCRDLLDRNLLSSRLRSEVIELLGRPSFEASGGSYVTDQRRFGRYQVCVTKRNAARRSRTTCERFAFNARKKKGGAVAPPPYDSPEPSPGLRTTG